MPRNKRIYYVVQSNATIGLNRVDNLTVQSIAGRVVNHDHSEGVAEKNVNPSVGSGESIAIAFSENVWVNGKRVC